MIVFIDTSLQSLWITINLHPNPSSLTAEGSLQTRSHSLSDLSLSLMLWPTASRPVSLGIKHPWGLLVLDICGFLWRSLFIWREDGFDFYNCCWPSPAHSFSGPSPMVLVTSFYCLIFETSLFVASYDSQGHGGGTRTRLHTGDLWFGSVLYHLYSLEADP
jgi:hypothetical protein